MIYHAQSERAYMVYLLYCGIINPHWCQLCSILMGIYTAYPSGERVSNRSWISMGYSLYSLIKYSSGTQLFTTRAHCCNH